MWQQKFATPVFVLYCFFWPRQEVFVFYVLHLHFFFKLLLQLPDFEAGALERNLNHVATRKTLQLTSIFHPTNGKHTRHMCVCISFVFCNLCVLYLYCAAFTDFEATIRWLQRTLELASISNPINFLGENFFLQI